MLCSPQVTPKERSTVLYAALELKRYSPLPLIGKFIEVDKCQVFELSRDKKNTITLSSVFLYEEGDLSVKSGEELVVERTRNPDDGWMVFLDEEGTEYLPLDRTNNPV